MSKKSHLKFQFVIFCLLGFAGCFALAADTHLVSSSSLHPKNIGDEQDCVILLHGLGRTSTSMKKIEEAFTAGGYTVWNQGYPSRSKPIEDMAGAILDPAMAFCRELGASKIHFITHSLGGIVVRQYLQEHRSQKYSAHEIGRIVMLSPPNSGSEVVDELKGLVLFRWVTGPAGQQLGTGKESLPNTLAPIEAEIGIITGSKSSNPWFSSLIPGEDDGKVSVESAKLEQMKDFLVLPYGHTTIMKKAPVIAQAQHFLRHGYFLHKNSD